MRKSNSHKIRTVLPHQITETSSLEEVHSCVVSYYVGPFFRLVSTGYNEVW